MSRPNAKVSISPSTPSAPTTCEFSRGRDLRRSRPELRFGHIPGNAPTVEGLQRKLEPLSLWGERRFTISAELTGRRILQRGEPASEMFRTEVRLRNAEFLGNRTEPRSQRSDG